VIGETTPINVEEENEDENANEVEIENEEEEDIIEEVPLRRSTRASLSFTKTRDYVTYKVKYSIKNFICYENVTKEYKVYLTSIKHNEPKNFEEAMANRFGIKR
jgi:hypothetical protein